VYPIDNYLREPLMLGAFLACAAPRVGYLTSVVILPQRQTALVAKQAAEVDVLSQGKLRFGLGIGWNPVEYEGLGMDFRNRGRRLEEQIQVMRELWTKPSVTFEGRYHRITAAGINPMPVQRPIPVWIGASAEPAIKRALEQGCGRVLGGHLEVRIDSGLDGVLVEEVGAETVDSADSCLFELRQRKAQPLALRRRPCLI